MIVRVSRLRIESATGLLTNVRQVFSPHRDSRPAGCVPELVVVRSGTPHQYVPFVRRAWHARTAESRGRSACNHFSIGIELEGADDVPYTDGQYESLNELIDALLEAYPSLSREHVVGHSDIAPGRKIGQGRRSSGAV